LPPRLTASGGFRAGVVTSLSRPRGKMSPDFAEMSSYWLHRSGPLRRGGSRESAITRSQREAISRVDTEEGPAAESADASPSLGSRSQHQNRKWRKTDDFFGNRTKCQFAPPRHPVRRDNEQVHAMPLRDPNDFHSCVVGGSYLVGNGDTPPGDLFNPLGELLLRIQVQRLFVLGLLENREVGRQLGNGGDDVDEAKL
jgi:hypothetical protein